MLPFYVSANTDEVEEEAERILKAERDLIGGKKVRAAFLSVILPRVLSTETNPWGKGEEPFVGQSY